MKELTNRPVHIQPQTIGQEPVRIKEEPIYKQEDNSSIPVRTPISNSSFIRPRPLSALSPINMSYSSLSSSSSSSSASKPLLREKDNKIQVYNPETDKYYVPDGKIGRELLKGYESSPQTAGQLDQTLLSRLRPNPKKKVKYTPPP